MVRSSDPRVFVGFRLGSKGRRWIGDLAVEKVVDLSTVIRCALIVARRHEEELKLLIEETK